MVLPVESGAAVCASDANSCLAVSLIVGLLMLLLLLILMVLVSVFSVLLLLIMLVSVLAWWWHCSNGIVPY